MVFIVEAELQVYFAHLTHRNVLNIYRCAMQLPLKFIYRKSNKMHSRCPFLISRIRSRLKTARSHKRCLAAITNGSKYTSASVIVAVYMQMYEN